MILRIKPSDAERREGGLDDGTRKDALLRFQRDGALLLDEIVDARFVEQGRQAFLEQYSNWLEGSRRDEARNVGDRRFMITIELAPPFDDQRLITNPWLASVLVDVLGDDYVLESFGVVCSLPGARRQNPHRDGGILFPELGINRLLPTVAVTVAIPLLEMNEINGTTELWLGSHRDFDRDADAEGVRLVVPEGSCALWDFRLLHGGTENRGSMPRPLLYLTYSRPWFVDHGNFGEKNPKQRRIIASADFLSGLGERDRRILARVRWQY